MEPNHFAPELRRISDLTPCNQPLFSELYKGFRKLRRSIQRCVNPERIGLTQDLLNSFVDDKFMMLYVKYHEEGDIDFLKAHIIKGLVNFGNRLKRMCYTGQANFYMNTRSLEVLYDNSKEDDSFNVTYGEDDEAKLLSEWQSILYSYLEVKLTPDEFLVYHTIFNPPPFIKERGAATIENLIDFFELPRDTASMRYISYCRAKVLQTLEEAKADLGR